MTDAYRDADNGSQSLMGASFALLALTTVFFACFLVSKYYNGAAISQLMFWLIVFAYVFNVGNAIVNALSVILGDAGKHIDTLDRDTYITSGKIGKASDYLYIPSAIFPKLAMLAFYSQLFRGRRIYDWTVYGCAGLLVCTLLAGVLQTTLICRPFNAYWLGHGKCGDMMASYRWLSYPNILTDFAMLVLPLPALINLQVSSTVKAKIILTFLTGSLGIITAILRLVSFYTIPIFPDATYYLIQPAIYSVVEPSAYLICAIMPTLRHLAHRSGSTSPKNNNHNNNTSLHTTNSSSKGFTTTYHEHQTTSTPKSQRNVYLPHIFSPTSFLSRFSGTMSSSSSQHAKTPTAIRTPPPRSINEPDLELGKVGLSPRTRQATSNRTEVGTGSRPAGSQRRRTQGGNSGGWGNLFLPEDAIVCQTDIDMISEPLGGGSGGDWKEGFGGAVRVDEERESDSAGGRIGVGLDLDGEVDGDQVPLYGLAEDKVRTRKRKSVVAGSGI
ncbi:unnamed protein product [Periconia digitata]|uniref:Rhodopsin domain-containing protein n=1 Tax=Periconia digitata TaxID=1303443 RepID=A0A9W4XK84_9PLEO|nr:unnamed protein product [Periconia digitata]